MTQSVFMQCCTPVTPFIIMEMHPYPSGTSLSVIHWFLLTTIRYHKCDLPDHQPVCTYRPHCSSSTLCIRCFVLSLTTNPCIRTGLTVPAVRRVVTRAEAPPVVNDDGRQSVAALGPGHAIRTER